MRQHTLFSVTILHEDHLINVSLMQVTPFSRWERELPKLVGDKRYLAIANMKERKVLFDEFCRSAVSAKVAAKGAAAAKSGGKVAANGTAAAAAADPEEAEAEAGQTDEAAAAEAADGVAAKPDAKSAFRCLARHRGRQSDLGMVHH